MVLIFLSSLDLQGVGLHPLLFGPNLAVEFRVKEAFAYAVISMPVILVLLKLLENLNLGRSIVDAAHLPKVAETRAAHVGVVARSSEIVDKLLCKDRGRGCVLTA